MTVAQLHDAMVDEGRLPKKVLCVRIDFTIQMKLNHNLCSVSTKDET